MNDDNLLKPCEVAEMLGVRSATVGYWARTGVLKPYLRTPGGQRRYRRADLLALHSDAAPPAPNETEQNAVRLYKQGRPIRRVADELGYSYGKTRRILLRHTTLRQR